MATKQLTISDLAESLNKQEIESGKRRVSQAKIEKAQLKVLTSLNENFSQYFQVQQKQSLDEAEAKRDAKQKAKPVQTDLPMFSDMVKGAKGKGFLAIIAAVGASIAGLVAGIFEGLKDTLKFLTPSKLSKLFDNKVVSNIKRLFGSIGEVFSKAGTGQILTKSTRETLGKFIGKLQDLSKSLKKPIGALENARSMLFYLFTSIGKVLKWLALLPLNILIKAKGGTLRVFDKLVGFFKSIKSSISGILKKSSVITDQFDNIKKLFGQFFSFGKKAKDAGEGVKKGSKIFSVIGKFLGPFFDIFKRLGKFIGGPITLAIFAIIDSFMGAFKGFSETTGGLGEKVLGGIFGAISGLVSGFIGGLLDLVKMFIGFVAGIFGFDGVKEKLSKFSFTDQIFDGLMKLFNWIKDRVSGFLSIFGIGGDDEDTPKVGGVKLTAKSREARSRLSKQTSEQVAANVGSRGSSARRLEERRKSKEDAVMKAQTASNVLIQDNSTNTSSSGGGQQQTGVLSIASMTYDTFDHGTRTA
jgi:hypothetical protein